MKPTITIKLSNYQYQLIKRSLEQEIIVELHAHTLVYPPIDVLSLSILYGKQFCSAIARNKVKIDKDRAWVLFQFLLSLNIDLFDKGEYRSLINQLDQPLLQLKSLMNEYYKQNNNQSINQLT